MQRVHTVSRIEIKFCPNKIMLIMYLCLIFISACQLFACLPQFCFTRDNYILLRRLQWSKQLQACCLKVSLRNKFMCMYSTWEINYKFLVVKRDNYHYVNGKAENKDFAEDLSSE
ncbi:hypothetical protein PR048_008066 [Dryococelus australis]|uniref:Uncharacterized protein n=1 Tax=Dryococelus australis TaxID=614101 RepID=A0ABQ9HW74_9NEOP|nr:hypothetical protein PR048_008066 [Dryococelus australis]